MKSFKDMTPTEKVLYYIGKGHEVVIIGRNPNASGKKQDFLSRFKPENVTEVINQYKAEYKTVYAVNNSVYGSDSRHITKL